MYRHLYDSLNFLVVKTHDYIPGIFISLTLDVRRRHVPVDIVLVVKRHDRILDKHIYSILDLQCLHVSSEFFVLKRLIYIPGKHISSNLDVIT